MEREINKKKKKKIKGKEKKITGVIDILLFFTTIRNCSTNRFSN
jgi:hypothetical protein